MSFLVFLMVLLFLTVYAAVGIQANRLARQGNTAWGLIPASLIRRLSVNAYSWAIMVVGWAFVIIGAVIYNSDLKDHGGPFWCAAYLSALVALFSFFWLKNRSVELKP